MALHAAENRVSDQPDNVQNMQLLHLGMNYTFSEVIEYVLAKNDLLGAGTSTSNDNAWPFNSLHFYRSIRGHVHMTPAQGGGRGVQKEDKNGQGGGQANLDVIFLDDIKLSFAPHNCS